MMSQIKQPQVTVLDYGVGNLLSVQRAFEKSGADVLISDRKEDILRAERLVLPGVGAFGDCVSALNSRGFKQAIIEFAGTGKPLLGICVGMQLISPTLHKWRRNTRSWNGPFSGCLHYRANPAAPAGHGSKNSPAAIKGSTPPCICAARDFLTLSRATQAF